MIFTIYLPSLVYHLMDEFNKALLNAVKTLTQEDVVKGLKGLIDDIELQGLDIKIRTSINDFVTNQAP